MRYRPTIIVILLMLFGFQSTVAAVSVDIHTDEQGCLELSVEATAADCDSLDSHDVASIESTEHHDHELTVCDHCGGCCNCHSNASVLSTFDVFIARPMPHAANHFVVSYLSLDSLSLYRPPIA